MSSAWLTKRLWKIMLAVDAEPLRAALEHQPIGLAVVLLDVRMRGAEHDVDGVGMAREDRGQRVDDVLDALVGREQAEGEDHRLALDAELVLAARRTARSGCRAG